MSIASKAKNFLGITTRKRRKAKASKKKKKTPPRRTNGEFRKRK